jgi:hypothetical protein
VLKQSTTNYIKYLKESLNLLENLEYHYEHVNWEEKQKLLKILFPEKLIFKNGQYINPSKDGISLLVEDIKEFKKKDASGKSCITEIKVVKKLGRVG